ncbi:beta-ketoacyl-ACP synthase II [Micromonospora sp. FIMYZ51]|uniref:beta-ketoacyl-[acyl-carrier-protein] synthase family protein n=1 Tax=Micromonospora sp. FIMYZ51 TaxID=3051832 RepID=UPI00311F99D3
MTRRAVVTGIGPVTPVGTGRRDFWASLVAGRAGIGPITRFDPSVLSSRIAGQVDQASPAAVHPPARRAERFSLLAHEAARLALADARLAPADVDGDRAAVVLGSAYGGLSRVETDAVALRTRGAGAVLPHLSSSGSLSAAAALVSMAFGFTGPVECPAGACATGAQAVARGLDLIRLDAADVVVAGGTDAALSPLFMASFCAARALSRRNDDPAAASRPFDRDRDGFVFSEGAVVLVLEEYEFARARGAPVLAEVLGHGEAGDAYSPVAPHPQGAGILRAMQRAVRAAGVTPAEIGYVNAHAASTPVGDVAEVHAIRTLFGGAPPPVSSTKSMTGHLLGAAGALAAAVAVLTVATGWITPTINLESPDPRCDIDGVPHRAREKKTEVAMSNAIGLGGINCALVFGR